VRQRYGAAVRVAPTRPLVRTLIAVVALGTLAGACSSKDDPPSGADVFKSTCDLLAASDLSRVTGIEFDDKVPGEHSCTYTSSTALAAIALNLTDVKGKDPDEALATSSGTCDSGSVVQLDLDQADGGFACTVSGVATVAAIHNDVYAVLTGATRSADVTQGRILRDLGKLLEQAIARI
jgi:hypothetical protein